MHDKAEDGVQTCYTREIDKLILGLHYNIVYSLNENIGVTIKKCLLKSNLLWLKPLFKLSTSVKCYTIIYLLVSRCNIKICIFKFFIISRYLILQKMYIQYLNADLFDAIVFLHLDHILSLITCQLIDLEYFLIAPLLISSSSEYHPVVLAFNTITPVFWHIISIDCSGLWMSVHSRCVPIIVTIIIIVIWPIKL
ncbi:hypothetical protein AGLY_010835 [Aphis glycines]|uniref:Uncharacterized protein n=1 Tax=Aphis glycines TaxID=307491 RepID=A0A6G0TEN8_APHGL|nr:hypothetical protein AGLY_010835 [Aphis glycines]